MELDEYGFGDVRLMEGERVDSSLNLSDGGIGDSGADVMLLTDKRIIHLHGDGRSRNASFASIQDIDAVETSSQAEGRSGYIWGAMAFAVAVLLYVVIDHPVGRIAAAVIVALMGVYLVADQLMEPAKRSVIFKAASSQLGCSLGSECPSGDVYAFINRVFELKEENGSEGSSRAKRFAPR